MSLSDADVAKVALLARLRLNPEELETFTGQLNSIVDYVAQLQELDTTGVEPLAHGDRGAQRLPRRRPRAGARPRARRWPTPPSGTRWASWFPPFWSDRIDSCPRHGRSPVCHRASSRAEDADR